MKPTKNTAKTPLLRQLQTAFKLALYGEENHITSSELAGMHEEKYVPSRRRFIEQSAKGLIALGVGGTLLESCKKISESGAKYEKGKAKIVIVGAGMAGLHCAYLLSKKGISSKIYEANTRTGGRIYTANGIMGTGLTTELGGEFIDTGHWDMRKLATEFGFPLLDTASSANAGLISDAYYFNGQHYSKQNVIDAFKPIAGKIQSDIDKLPDVITYDNPGAAVQFDNISLEQYINNLSCDQWLKDLLNVAFLTEYGLETGEQSCINMLYLISTITLGGKFDIFGDSDERFKIAGGNQQLTDALTSELRDSIAFGYSLEAVNKTYSGKYVLTFQNPSNTPIDITADFVVFALPFTKLRDVNFGFNLPVWKNSAIKRLGYGTNAKLMVGFNNRPWRTLGYRGYAFTDESFQLGWDNSELQATTNGGYTMFTGGDTGVKLGNGTPQSQAAIHLPGFEKVFPGSVANQNGKIERMHWPTAPFAKGSYACYRPGQFTTIAGAEQKTVDNMFFAGEHCSLNFQGFMNGAAETGRIAAENLLKAI